MTGAAGGSDAGYVEELVRAAIAEDLAGGVDVTTVATVPADSLGIADFVVRGNGVLAGTAVAWAALHAVDPAVEVSVEIDDGTVVGPGDVVITARGATRSLLTAERTALNLLCHLSGVATLTAAWVAAVDGTGVRIRDTRKTTPGLRVLEKYAVRCGGGVNHRSSLSEAALIKDNHVLAAGGVGPAFAAVRAQWPDLSVEVEADTVEQVRQALAAGADLVLLDNMSLADLRASVALARSAGARTEASGGLTLARAREVAATGVDFISVGALTHSAPVLDIAADLRTESV
ncbi:MAG: carboxylating nicotinate-nucleotide diphosphorylase [Mycobacteriales bacterium]